MVPDSVVLSGPRTYMRRYREVYSETFSKNNVVQPVDIDLALKIPTENNIESNAYTVHFTQAVEQLGEQVVNNIPVRLVGVPARTRVELSPSEISLTVSSAISRLTNIKPEDINVYFDFRKNWKYGENYYVPMVELPEGVISWRNMSPRRIEVRIVRGR